MSTNTPLVTVIIPVYNVCRYLPQCLESVIHQTYTNLEIIIIDDGSTDGCDIICDSYARNDQRITVFHTENHGLASARNLGLNHAAGAFITFIDSDDWYERNAIQYLVQTEANTRADIVTFQSTKEYQNKTVHRKDKPADKVFHGNEIMMAYVHGTLGAVAWNKLYRKDCFENIRFPDGHNYEDISTTWKVLKKLSDENRTIVYTNNELIHFRLRKSSITHTVSFANIRDHWIADYDQYQKLSEYRKWFLGPCYISIARLYAHYDGFSESEKQEAQSFMQEMHDFSKAHSNELLRGRYSLKEKVSCLLSLSKSLPMLKFDYYAAIVRRTIIHAIPKNTLFE